MSIVRLGAKAIDTTDPVLGQVLSSTDGVVLGRRNMIINGDMRIAQRATSATGINTSGYYTVDRVDVAMSTTAGEFTQSQVTDAPEGFSHALKFDCTTADTSVAAGETTIVMWQLEGQDVQRMLKGTSNAKQVTVSFYAKANAAKTYICELKDFTNTRTVSKAFTVGTSYTRHEITFPADTTGAITSNNAKGLSMNIWLHAGSTYSSGTLQTTWGPQVNANRCAGIDNFFSSTDNTFFITGVQMEVGESASEFEHRPIAEEQINCYRYFYKITRTDPYGEFLVIRTYSSTQGTGVMVLPAPMRVQPTFTSTTPINSNFAYTMTVLSFSTTDSGTTGSSHRLATHNVVGAFTSGGAAVIQKENNTNPVFMQYDAEL